MFKGFKTFLMQGNIVDLAVAVVIGAAFTTLVKAFTDQVIQPLISSIGAGGDHSYGVLRIHLLGDNYMDLNAVLSATINFVLVAAVIYFVIVLPYSKFRNVQEDAVKKEVELLTQIRDLLEEKK
ncbi:large-conductance mechanosensitive channel protein MscL [Mycobacterium sp. CBMA293]|uniref:large-conductance mechanosensitive channel protein MscL n=1 Tax=unclassified Mycolicibacterium TaxID=2636767 RepID=UPI0012DC4B41|nr:MULTISPECIES: large-conductance mechanosensitive channel protein MscL [unclassified Mycolicibacterium]MUL49995.1 large-conductance mechanosensitive channel protein MscL [Mycolicibacterium sp. CBMA 360]MUL61601.1 large-conductance mechanosensitive channel protein MscL [Mycolicibacterium sp. CBMA 335]MUL74336.1 large-conductance mechanosensitive channel protein MscL [Mycolicibacterium sp. CBMA 311]MUL96613.1 large-conductance mechanosensitive channel protein MscL [Mycolicibacterium sp. CBMA 23